MDALAPIKHLLFFYRGEDVVFNKPKPEFTMQVSQCFSLVSFKTKFFMVEVVTITYRVIFWHEK